MKVKNRQKKNVLFLKKNMTLLQKVFSNWHVIATLQKDEKLIVHPDGKFSKDPYRMTQFIGRRLLGHGSKETHQGMAHLWEITVALADGLLEHESLNKIRRFPLNEMKDIEQA